jgi:GT2 family glycosyltransferase
MSKIGIVVLNYLTYNDTYELINTLNQQVENENFTVYIVDNGSDKNKYLDLKNDLSNLLLSFHIKFLNSSENVGFAKGMNIGIIEAKKDGCEFIICSNNDILFNKKINFNKFLDIYDSDNSIAVIGPKILNFDMFNQNPYIINNPFKKTFSTRMKKKIIFGSLFGKCLFFIRGLIKSIFKKDAHLLEELKDSNYIHCLHGSFFMLTPSYFKYYQTLDKNTFLYGEELILAERVRSKNLKEYYCSKIEVIHKDDSSTNEMLGKDSFKKKYFILSENYKSLKYFMKEYL